MVTEEAHAQHGPVGRHFTELQEHRPTCLGAQKKSHELESLKPAATITEGN